MPYKGHTERFIPSSSHANLIAKILDEFGPHGRIPNPRVVILCDDDGDVVIITAQAPTQSISVPSGYQITYKYEDGPSKEGEAADPCWRYIAAGNEEEICW